MQGARFASERLLSLSEKRKVDAENTNGNGDDYQYPGRRRPRKVNYGKCQVDIAGGEAAPYEVFIGNTKRGQSGHSYFRFLFPFVH